MIYAGSAVSSLVQVESVFRTFIYEVQRLFWLTVVLPLGSL